MSENLNHEQKKAILHFQGPMMVLAGPGSGKTMVLTWRILCLRNHHQVDEDQILVLTYTKAAAQEMRSRFFRLLGTDQSLVRFGTIHSICLELLRGSTQEKEEEDLLTEEEALKELVPYLMREEQLSRRDSLEKGREILQHYSYLRNVLQESDWKDGLEERTVRFYERMKKETDRMDFDDILIGIRHKLMEDPEFLEKVNQRFSFLLVDEFQDVSPLQYDILKRMSSQEQNLFVVGDDDQAIYGFRGSQSAIMQQFPQDYPDCSRVILQVNYRSREEIVRFAGSFICHNQVRYEKDILSGRKADTDERSKDGESGGLWKQVKSFFLSREPEKGVELHRSLSESAEGRAVASYLKQWQDHTLEAQAAILLRTSFEAENYRSFLMDYGVSFEVFGEQLGPYHHWIGEDLWCVYRASHQDPQAQKKLFQMLYPKESDSLFYWESSRRILEGGEGDLLESLIHQVREDELYIKLSELSYELKKLAVLSPVDVLDRLMDRSEYNEYLKEKAYKRQIPFSVLQQRVRFWRKDLKNYKNFEDWNRHRLYAILHPSRELPEIRFETIHSSKGLEYDRVVIPGIIQRRMPHPRSNDLEEERRLLYVAITRAREGVYLSSFHTKEPDSVFWGELKEAFHLLRSRF